MKIDFAWPKGALKEEKLKEEKLNISSEATFKNSAFFSTPSNHESIPLTINKAQPKSINLEKTSQLNALKAKKKEDTNLIFANQGNNFVFDDGNLDAKLMFIGEAPGEEEDKKQVPFIGRSGQLLRYFLKEAGLNDIYITNIISWRPPKNRTPTEEEIEIMKPYIMEHVKIIQPKIIITVGTTALKAFNIRDTITKAQSNIYELEIGKIYPIYHPSYALRVQAKKKELWISLLKLKSIMTNLL